jgi:hypothetical protein
VLLRAVHGQRRPHKFESTAGVIKNESVSLAESMAAVWLPGMDSNQIFDRFYDLLKLLILQSH